MIRVIALFIISGLITFSHANNSYSLILSNESHYFIIMRGGSYYHPTSSWWYVKGGPQPLDQSQFLLRVSQGFERNATVGFRCVVDAK